MTDEVIPHTVTDEGSQSTTRRPQAAERSITWIM